VEPRRNALVTLELLVDGRLQGETDCGTYFGGYVLDGAGISLSVIDTGTEPCGSRREAEVVSLIAVLEAAATWEGTATGTVLLDAEGIIRVELEPATQKGLAGAWLATALATPGGVLQAVPPTTPVELAFGAGGGLTGTTGCRLFEGEYLSEADQALLVPTDTTGLPCEGDLQALEERFLEALQAVILWERNGAELRLTDAVGNVLIELIATSG
jgi:heat shock protein HslJ